MASAPSMISQYDIARAKIKIAQLHPLSEMSQARREHVHHIFMKSEFPQYAASLENLISLTVHEHMSKAHPNSNTYRINIGYRARLLNQKISTIDQFLSSGNTDYNRGAFIEIVNTGLMLNLHRDTPRDDFQAAMIRAVPESVSISF